MLSVCITLLKKLIDLRDLLVFNRLKMYFNPKVEIAEFERSKVSRDLFSSNPAANFNIRKICRFIEESVSVFSVMLCDNE